MLADFGFLLLATLNLAQLQQARGLVVSIILHSLKVSMCRTLRKLATDLSFHKAVCYTF